MFSPRSSDRRSSFSRGCCDEVVASVRGVAGSVLSSEAVPFLSSTFVSFDSLLEREWFDDLLGRSPHREKLRLEVALDGMNLSERPT